MATQGQGRPYRAPICRHLGRQGGPSRVCKKAARWRGSSRRTRSSRCRIQSERGHAVIAPILSHRLFVATLAKGRRPAMHAIGPLYSVCGFVGGLVVGMTGVGGGSLPRARQACEILSRRIRYLDGKASPSPEPPGDRKASETRGGPLAARHCHGRGGTALPRLGSAAARR